MKINFIIPFVNMTGGIKVIFEYCNRLKEKGHDILIYVPIKAYKFNNSSLGVVKASLGNYLKSNKKVDWFDLKVQVKAVPVISNKYIRDADSTIATAWPTAYDVEKLDSNKGKKIYFIQHYEEWSGNKELVDGSYKLDLNQIVIAGWLKNLMKEKFNKEASIIYNGIDKEEFIHGDKKENDNVVCLILYHNLEWKGFEDGLKAFKMAQKEFPNIKLKAFGHCEMEKKEDLEFYKNPSRDDLKNIYGDSDIYIFPSKNEGWGLTVLEAMANKCAVVGTNTGALSEVGKNYVNSLISEPEDINRLADNLIRLIKNPTERKKIADEGHELALSMQWEVSVEKFEKYLKS